MQITCARELASEQCGGPRVQIGVARERDIQRLELPCRPQKKRRGFAAPARGEGDLPTQQVNLCTPQLVQRPGPSNLRRGQQLQSRIERADLQIRLRGRERAFGPSGRLARQRDRALQKRRRRGHAATGLRPAGRPLELRGDLLIGSRRRRRQVPRPPVRVEFAISHLGQRQVRRPALG